MWGIGGKGSAIAGCPLLHLFSLVSDPFISSCNYFSVRWYWYSGPSCACGCEVLRIYGEWNFVSFVKMTEKLLAIRLSIFILVIAPSPRGLQSTMWKRFKLPHIKDPNSILPCLDAILVIVAQVGCGKYHGKLHQQIVEKPKRSYEHLKVSMKYYMRCEFAVSLQLRS